MYAAYRWGRCNSKRGSSMGLTPEKREFLVEIEGVVKRLISQSREFC